MDTAMNGKTCMVTGATSGIGLETARGLARLGASVVLVGRNAERCTRALDSIRETTGNERLECIVADLSSQKEVRRVANEFRSRHDQLHVLINNAAVNTGPRRESPDGIELTFAVNHLGYFLLTNLLLDVLRASAPARIVNVASEVHREVTLDFDDLQARKGRFNGYTVYKKSKLANLLFTYELARRLQGSGVTVNAVAPGLVKTNLGLQDPGMAALMKRAINALWGITPQQAAQFIVHTATTPQLEGVSGKYHNKGKETESSPASRNEADAARLWQISAEMTGLAG